MIVKRVISVFRAGGPSGVLSAIVRRLRRFRARSYPLCQHLVRDVVGIEIGGPSPIFASGGLVPVYRLAARVDNCNFARRTIWEGSIEEGYSFRFHTRKAPGKQFIAEGSDLHMIPAETYDFVLSSHMIEHTANPLRALEEWSRLLKPGGGLLLVVPHRDGTFDHCRPVTTLEHLIADFDAGVGEDDRTHVPEILALHDHARDPGQHEISFGERAERNAEFRSLHHHVFDTRLVVELVRRAALTVESVEPLEPYHVVVIARKRGGKLAPQDLSRERLREILMGSPFPTDRRAS